MDHKLIGENLKLFLFSDLASAQIMLLPKGLIMFNTLKNIMRGNLLKHNFVEVGSATVGKINLWEKTKHTDKYAENLFQISHDSMLKPMNCPMHYIIAQKMYQQKSILPIKVFEFNHCFRKEQTGSVCGMFRLCRFTQDDSHSIINLQDISIHLNIFFEEIYDVYGKLGFEKENIKVRFSKVDKDIYIGDKNQYDKAHDLLYDYLSKNKNSIYRRI